MPATLKSRIPQIAASIQPRVEAAMRSGAEAIAESAKARVPVLSGELRDAIHVDAQDEGYYVVAGDDDAFYGHMIEFGTSRFPAEPFLIPAAEEQREPLENAVSAALRRL